MATIKTVKRKNGATAYQINWYENGKRRYLSLGSAYSKREVENARVAVERIQHCEESGEPLDRRTQRWLEDASPSMRDRLEAAGLIKVERDITLEELWDAYWEDEYYQMKPTTQSNKRQSRRRFFEYFDKNSLTGDLTKRDALKFVEFLDRMVGEATRAGTLRDVRRVYNWAKEVELLDRCPFDGIPRGSFRNKTREYFISREDYEKMLDACPSNQWRVLLALYRIGGLRKEEALHSVWSDVDFARGRLLVHSPKTERYVGMESRVIPLFPELREELERLWDSLDEGGSAYIIAENRTTITKHIEKIVFFAGLNRWERLIQNLRSSRAIEVFEDFGALAEAEWIGHSAKTARDHYLHVLDETFERAASFRGREVQQPAATPKTTPKKTKENERERKRAKQENRSSPVKRRMTR